MIIIERKQSRCVAFQLIFKWYRRRRTTVSFSAKSWPAERRYINKRAAPPSIHPPSRTETRQTNTRYAAHSNYCVQFYNSTSWIFCPSIQGIHLTYDRVRPYSTLCCQFDKYYNRTCTPHLLLLCPSVNRQLNLRREERPSANNWNSSIEEGLLSLCLWKEHIPLAVACWSCDDDLQVIATPSTTVTGELARPGPDWVSEKGPKYGETKVMGAFHLSSASPPHRRTASFMQWLGSKCTAVWWPIIIPYTYPMRSFAAFFQCLLTSRLISAYLVICICLGIFSQPASQAVVGVLHGEGGGEGWNGMDTNDNQFVTYRQQSNNKRWGLLGKENGKGDILCVFLGSLARCTVGRFLLLRLLLLWKCLNLGQTWN